MVKSVNEEPHVVLTHWGLMQQNGVGFRLVGVHAATGIPRVTSPIVDFEEFTMTATTESGRTYRLRRPRRPGYHRQGHPRAHPALGPHRPRRRDGRHQRPRAGAAAESAGELALMAGKRGRILSRWGFVMAGGRGPVLAGEEGLGMHRTSTPLVEFDPVAMTGVTASGRPYRLAGEPEPGYALSVFHSLWDADGVDVRIVGLEEALVLIEGNEPFAFPPEEQARLDGLKLRHLAQSVASQMRIQDLSVDEAATIAGLPAERLRALLEHDMSGITPDEATGRCRRLSQGCGDTGPAAATFSTISGCRTPMSCWRSRNSRWGSAI